MKSISKIAASVLAIAFFSMGFIDHPDTVTDTDGNNYKTIKIGNQIWMAENLKVKHYRNGDEIHNDTIVMVPETGGWCDYKNDTANDRLYGKLYNWYAATDARGIAPKGWHVPSDSEVTVLVNFLGGEKIAGRKMKSNGGWGETRKGGGTNESGFTAVPGGCGSIIPGGEFRCFNYVINGDYLTCSQDTTDKVYGKFRMRTFAFAYNYDQVFRSYDGKRSYLSVRCVKD
jgi:uncharacterized protein (TIGR02145 family)